MVRGAQTNIAGNSTTSGCSVPDDHSGGEDTSLFVNECGWAAPCRVRSSGWISGACGKDLGRERAPKRWGPSMVRLLLGGADVAP